METSRFDLLLDHFLSGEATAEELAELAALLRADPEKRRVLAMRSLLEVQMRKAFSGIAMPEPAPAAVPTAPVPITVPMTPSRGRIGIRWAAAAAVLFAMAAGIYVISDIQKARIPPAAIDSGQVRINKVEVPNIPADQPFEVTGDKAAVVRLADGSQAEFEPGTKALLRRPSGSARQIIELQEGGGAFSVTKAQAQFQVETPVGTVAVVGTEFTVQLSRPNANLPVGEQPLAMRVAVRTGSVAVHAGSKSYLLSAGDDRIFPEPDKTPPATEIALGNKEPTAKPDPEDHGVQEIEATLKAIDAAKGSIVVRTRENNKETERRIDVSKDASIFLADALAQLGDLKAGMGIHLMLSGDGKMVLEIQQNLILDKQPGKDANIKDKNQTSSKGSASVRGTVKTTDAVKQTITVAWKEKGTAMERVFPVVQGAAISIGGKKASLSDVQPGMEVRLRLSQSRQTVIEIRIEGKKGKS